jgi:hypothetical protein
MPTLTNSNLQKAEVNEFTLRSSELYEKYGFGDGQMFDDWLDEHLLPSDNDDDFISSSELVSAAVHAYLLPLIKPAIEVWEGNHNPVRAQDPDDKHTPLTPEFVVVTAQQLVDLFPTRLSLTPVERDEY